MSISVGAHGSQQFAGAASFTTTTYNTQASGSVLYLWLVFGSGSVTFSSVSDSKSNTWTLIQSEVVSSGGFRCRLYKCETLTGGSGHTFSLATAGGSSGAAIFVTEVLGSIGSGATDQAPVGLNDTSSPFTSTATGTTSQANELALAFTGTDTPSGTEVLTWGNSFTQLDNQGNSAGSTGATAQLTLSAVGTVQSSFTSNVATSAVSFIVTVKAAGITLTGQTTTSSEGTVSPNVSYTLGNQTATFTEGTISASSGGNVTLSLSGQTGTFTEGTIAPNIGYSLNDGVPLTGQTATFTEGTPTETLAYSLTGQSVTSTPGTLTPSVSYALTGQSVTSSEGTITPSVPGNVTVQLGSVTGQFTMGLITLSGVAPAGRHHRRFGVFDGDRLLVFDTRAEVETAKQAIAARDLPQPRNARKLKVKPIPPAREVIALPEIAAAAQSAGEYSQYQALLAEPTRMADFYATLQARREEEETALHLLRTDREERQAHQIHILSTMVDLLTQFLRRRR